MMPERISISEDRNEFRIANFVAYTLHTLHALHTFHTHTLHTLQHTKTNIQCNIYNVQCDTYIACNLHTHMFYMHIYIYIYVYIRIIVNHVCIALQHIPMTLHCIALHYMRAYITLTIQYIACDDMPFHAYIHAYLQKYTTYMYTYIHLYIYYMLYCIALNCVALQRDTLQYIK